MDSPFSANKSCEGAGQPPQLHSVVNISDSPASPGGGERAEPVVAQQPMKDLFATLCQSYSAARVADVDGRWVEGGAVRVRGGVGSGSRSGTAGW